MIVQDSQLIRDDNNIGLRPTPRFTHVDHLALTLIITYKNTISGIQNAISLQSTISWSVYIIQKRDGMGWLFISIYQSFH